MLISPRIIQQKHPAKTLSSIQGQSTKTRDRFSDDIVCRATDCHEASRCIVLIPSQTNRPEQWSELPEDHVLDLLAFLMLLAGNSSRMISHFA